ncbi:hypothetical protein [Kutzneria sp. NPDC051319]|uniref:GH12 family glycosyl hydrolase domain-containing protein n=1 Tax=Kutzneria sp. NPDC051319 TaxID=3155047 RepID=UPI0034308909
MRAFLRCATVGVATVAAVALTASTSDAAAVWSSSAQWATWSNGGYTLRNDVWGHGAGPQTIWGNSYRDWGVNSNQPNTGGVKSYPQVAKAVNKKLSAIGSVTSNFAVSLPSGGSYEATYDIWADSNRYEIMLWMSKAGAVGPIGSKQATVTVGGHTWDVYKGSNGRNAVFSFLRQGNTTAGAVDVKAVLNWIKSKGWFGDVTLGDVQFGFEITSASGGKNFAVTDFGVSSS